MACRYVGDVLKIGDVRNRLFRLPPPVLPLRLYGRSARARNALVAGRGLTRLAKYLFEGCGPLVRAREQRKVE